MMEPDQAFSMVMVDRNMLQETLPRCCPFGFLLLADMAGTYRCLICPPLNHHHEPSIILLTRIGQGMLIATDRPAEVTPFSFTTPYPTPH